ncbi:CHAT domain-containing protein [Fretibacter rubidus]|uniref:CHAT domain-containing tetratricopeptide repeat protein n=1 Tax=Fretibacter rubidus TaxID=570162 RepID=UPI00352AA7FB
MKKYIQYSRGRAESFHAFALVFTTLIWCSAFLLIGCTAEPSDTDTVATNNPVAAVQSVSSQPNFDIIPPRIDSDMRQRSPLSPDANDVRDLPRFQKLSEGLQSIERERATLSPLEARQRLKALDNTVDAVAPASVILGYKSALQGQFEHEAGNYDVALNALKKAVQIYEDADFAESAAYLRVLTDLPETLTSLGQTEAAQTAFERAETAVLDFYGSPSVEYGEILAEKGFRAYYANDLKNAVTFIEKGVAMIEHMMDRNDVNAVTQLVSFLSSLSAVTQEAGNQSRSLDASTQAMQLAVSALPEDNMMRANVLHNHGAIMNARGRHSEGAQMLRQSLRLHLDIVGRGHPMTTYSIYNLAVSEGNLGNYAVAEDLFMQAHSLFLDKGAGQEQPAYLTLQNAARMAAAQGKSIQAIEQFEAAIAGLERAVGKDNPLLITPLNNLALQYRSVGQVDAAIKRLDQAQALSAQHQEVGSPLSLETQMLHAVTTGDFTQSRIVFSEAIDIATARAADTTSGSSSPLSQYAPVFEHFAADRLKAGDFDTAITAMQFARLNDFNALIRKRAARTSLTEGAARQRLRERQDAQFTMRRADQAYQTALASNDSTRIQAAQATLEDARNAVAKALKATPLTTDETQLTVSLANIQDRLTEKEAVWMSFLTGAEPILVLVTPDSIHTATMPLSKAALSEHVSALRASVLDTEKPFDTNTARALYQALFPENLRRAMVEVEHLYILPEDGLTQIPFSFLVTNTGESPRYVNDDMALTTLPSLNALGETDASTPRRPRFLGVGAPRLGGTDDDVLLLASNQSFYRDGRGATANIRSLPPLPYAAKELTALSQAFGRRHSTVLTDNAATQSGVIALDLANYDVIAFSTHGLVSGRFEGQTEPALILTPGAASNPGPDQDGLLTQSEISRMPLDADWVILSACNTAAGDAQSAAGLSGLASAFLYAGADSLLVSHWPVRDDVAAFLTVKTVKNTQAGMSKSQALRAAINDLRKSRLKGAEHPAIWAPFVVVGG